jgi:hypothetical protein
MRTDLRDRLADLAEHTPPGSPPADLWDRGVRRHRVAQVGRVVVAAVLVSLIGLGGWTWQSTRPVEPADTHGSPHLPDRFFYNVSPWTHAFDGPPGPLVTVFPHLKETVRHTSNGIIGVSASSTSYGFLDLPQNAVVSPSTAASLALSPDGRRLAFWFSGTPRRSPNTTLLDGETVTGVAVYDTVSGQVRESSIPTSHGLDPRTLIWADDSTLVFSYGQIVTGDGSQNSTTSRFGGAAAWDVSGAQQPPLDARALSPGLGVGVTRATAGELVMPGRHRRTWVVVDPTDRAAAHRFRTGRGSDVLVLSPDHTHAIGVIGRDQETGPLAVLSVPDGASAPEAPMHKLPLGHRWFRPLAWLDDEHVAVLEKVLVNDPVHGPHVSGRIDLVDLKTGSARPVVAEFGDSGSYDSDGWIATGLLQAPSVRAVPPPSPPNLRAWTVGLAVVGAIALLVVGLYLWGATRGRRA